MPTYIRHVATFFAKRGAAHQDDFAEFGLFSLNVVVYICYTNNAHIAIRKSIGSLFITITYFTGKP